MSEQKVRVGITIGDVNGVGCETIIKCFADSRLAELCTPIIYGSTKALAVYKKDIEQGNEFQYTLVANAKEARPKRVNVINVTNDDLKIEPGMSTPDAGKLAVAALKAVAADVKAGLIDVVVTAPINKDNVNSVDFGYTGHTEFFAAEAGGEPLMMMCSELLKVGLVTIHMPLAQVAENISQEKIVKRLVQLRKALISDFSIVEPKIAVLSLNPHAGDGGLLGNEEAQMIKPAIDAAYAQHVFAFGPFPADGFFAAGTYKKYDAVLAMYHDQGLAPFKALTPDGVNFTASLNMIRTSPDHGVAYDIAGKGVADESSMRSAIYMAIDLFRSRKTYKEISSNPLRRYEREKGADVSVKDLVVAGHENDL